jgi:hypothetical protein
LKKLIINILIFSGPLIICFLFLVIDDPFGVLYKSDCLAEASEDVLQSRTYLKEYSTKNYTSFIFGNSRTHAFTDNGWQSPGESLLNTQKKIELILSKQKIKNALILVDDGILENTDNEHRFYQGPVYNHSPITSNISHLQFYANYIGYYFSDYFFAKHIYFKLTKNYKEQWMKTSFKKPSSQNTNANCLNYPSLSDSLLETNFTEYKRVFKPDYKSYDKKQIKLDQRDIEHLKQIKQLLEENNVNYKIIYPPSFNKRKIEPKLKTLLTGLFSTNFYDFSGINKITTDSTLNYENLHFTYRAANIMLDSLYLRK